jgi:hypothetical protein
MDDADGYSEIIAFLRSLSWALRMKSVALVNFSSESSSLFHFLEFEVLTPSQFLPFESVLVDLLSDFNLKASLLFLTNCY